MLYDEIIPRRPISKTKIKMNNQQFERLVSNLQDIMRCPHCSARYTAEDIHYLGQLDSMTFLHLRCAGCATPVFASVALANELGDIIPAALHPEDLALSEMSPVEDLEDDFERRTLGDSEPREIPLEGMPAEELFAALNPVSYDDVLDTHQYLASFDGDFARILR